MILFFYGQDEKVMEVVNKNTKIFYHGHPLELGFMITLWKVQSLNFDKVILRLE